MAMRLLKHVPVLNWASSSQAKSSIRWYPDHPPATKRRDSVQQYWCVVPAAGCGRRVGGDCPKQYLPLAGRPLIEHTLKRLANHRHIAGLMVVLAEHDARWPGVSTLANKPVHTATGGAQRCDSVLAGLEALPAKVGACLLYTSPSPRD